MPEPQNSGGDIVPPLWIASELERSRVMAEQLRAREERLRAANPIGYAKRLEDIKRAEHERFHYGYGTLGMSVRQRFPIWFRWRVAHRARVAIASRIAGWDIEGGDDW